ncbi:MAG: sugar phosphate nucleotidyltransferase [Prosthecochloris sp.]|nr:sugar phosphate nucleotidyltransferase [Prosthecochloris sp.]
MKAFVLAAGFGTRLRPLTSALPKPLIPVLNLPAICYTLFLLKEAGIRDVICNVHYRAAAIREFFDRHGDFGLNLTISEETDILGTGGGLKKCEHLLNDGEFLLINSDIIADFSLTQLIDSCRAQGTSGSLMLYRTPLARSIGDIGIRDGMVVDFRNRRKTGRRSDFIYCGAAVLSPDIFQYLETGFSSIVDTGFTGLIDHGGLGYWEHTGFWHDIGTLESYRDLSAVHHRELLSLSQRMRLMIDQQPRLIDPDADISPEATLESSVIGAGCRVGPGAVVLRSVLLPGTSVGTDETVTDTIVCRTGPITPSPYQPERKQP